MGEADGARKSGRGRAIALLSSMSLAEKVGQLVQLNGEGLSDALLERIRAGGVGSVLNEVNPDVVRELQRVARHDSPSGIPLLIGRDVIHGFNTVFPVPLGLAATWHPERVAESAAYAAREAAACGVNWTFSPMLDVSRDARWGRIAESFGEDVHLTSVMGAAMVRGYQERSERPFLACLKHFVGYGASEGGRDYNLTYIPEVQLRNVYLPPFKACLDAGARTVMPSFSDLNGVPPTGNRWLMRDVLRDEWQFDGFVVSDWASVTQLAVHGVAEDARTSAIAALNAGTNMDMASDAYAHHVESLVNAGDIPLALVDELVTEILAVKFDLGLFDEALPDIWNTPDEAEGAALAADLAVESAVLLKNHDALLPLSRDLRVALIGPMADQPYEQMGTWMFDGDEARSVSVRDALVTELGNKLQFEAGLTTSRSHDPSRFADVTRMVADADVAVLVLGEEAILSGEAHCRTDITLPGVQQALLSAAKSAGKPVVTIILAGRPLALQKVDDLSDALIFAAHAGVQTGPAMARLLFGDDSPSGKLPFSMPRVSGQVPMYYAEGNTGKPATPETIVHMDDIDPRVPQLSVGNTSFHLDVHPSPLYPFGFGLTYSSFDFDAFRVDDERWLAQGELEFRVQVSNVGERAATEVIQLYMRDPVASVARPLRELKAFSRVSLAAGESGEACFVIAADDLMFFDGNAWVLEPGRFDFWVGNSVLAPLHLSFEVNPEEESHAA